jgi:hypothetical protein
MSVIIYYKYYLLFDRGEFQDSNNHNYLLAEIML